MCPDELRSLRQNANEMEGKDIGLVYDLLYPQQLSLLIPRRFDDPAHLLDYDAGQVASSRQLQSTCLGCSSQQEYRIGRDRRCRDFCRSQVVFEADGRITGRGFVMKGIETVEFEHGPGRFDAIQPSTNFGILQESWRNHIPSDTGLGIRSLPD